MAKAKKELDIADTEVGQQIQVHLARSCEIVHRCFDQCITNLNEAAATPEEERCVGICALRFAHFIRRTAPKTMEMHVAHYKKAMEEMQAKVEQEAASQATAEQVLAPAANGASDVRQDAVNSGQQHTAT